MMEDSAPAAPGAVPDLAPRTRGPALPTAALETRAGTIWVRTLVQLGPGGEDALVAQGAEIGVRAGDIVTARIPLDAVRTLLAQPGIRRMDAAAVLSTGTLDRATLAQPVSPSAAASRDAVPLLNPSLSLNDSANADANFDALRRRVGDRWEGIAGQGVIVGVYDTGLDLAHDDFLDPDGSTRVLFAWDQTRDGTPPGAVGAALFGYGDECPAARIDDGGCGMRDMVGHGTHVAGVAAGDGSATGNGQPAYRFPGGAPAADLIVVKGGDGAFTADRVVEGVAYIFERAAAMGKAAVVNLSLSSSQGPHDGSTLLEQALDALSGPGRIIVSGTGNMGDHRNTDPVIVNGPNHATGTAGGPPSGIRIPAYIPASGSENDGVALELWYDGADSLTITVRSPGGHEVVVPFGDSALTQTPDGSVGVLNAVDAAPNGDHGVLIVLIDYAGSPPPAVGSWTLEVTGTVHGDGGYHLWITGHSLAVLERPPGLLGGADNRYLVGVPASADRVLAAGGHVTKHGWTGLGGTAREFPAQEELGDIAFFSSTGPRTDGVQKPDVTAPSKVLISSLSRDATLFDGSLSWLIEQDSVHVGFLGTSMASPQLAAAVAVLLQVEPSLTPEEARDLIRLSAKTDAFVPAAVPNPVWGSGKLDAAAAMQRLRPAGLSNDGREVVLSANPVRGDALVISYSEVPRSIAVYTLIAERVRGLSGSDIGALTTIWDLETDAGGAVANGAYVLVVEFEDRRVLRKILVARP